MINAAVRMFIICVVHQSVTGRLLVMEGFRQSADAGFVCSADNLVSTRSAV